MLGSIPSLRGRLDCQDVARGATNRSRQQRGADLQPTYRAPPVGHSGHGAIATTVSPTKLRFTLAGAGLHLYVLPEIYLALSNKNPLTGLTAIGCIASD
jgi:hypothetical protein